MTKTKEIVWPPKPVICQHCKVDINVGDGLEQEAVQQLFGIWLCEHHLERVQNAQSPVAGCLALVGLMLQSNRRV